MLDIALKLLLSYLVGGIMGGLVIGRLRGGVDIRSMGSGNLGGTNALRTQGKLFGIGVILIDVAKGAVAAGVIPGLFVLGATAQPGWLPYACGAAAVLGHVFPAWSGFRGGKGAATLVGTILVLKPILVPPLLAVWALFIMLTGYVGLATMVTANTAALIVALTMMPAERWLLTYALFMGVLTLFTHRSNIVRMVRGTENHNPRLMVFKRK
jgi:glycerol-3-phosphate acyltransferase PlsY